MRMPVSYDYSTGEIRNCRFENAGNDAIDLVGSSPRILGNQVISAAERGVSIDGNSAPIIFNNQITGTDIGVEARGGALVMLFNNVVTRNRIGLMQDQAGGRGAWVKLLNNAIAGNVSDTEADQSARTTELEASNRSARGAQSLILQTFGLRTSGDANGLATSWARHHAGGTAGWSAVRGKLCSPSLMAGHR